MKNLRKSLMMMTMLQTVAAAATGRTMSRCLMLGTDAFIKSSPNAMLTRKTMKTGSLIHKN